MNLFQDDSDDRTYEEKIKSWIDEKLKLASKCYDAEEFLISQLPDEFKRGRI